MFALLTQEPLNYHFAFGLREPERSSNSNNNNKNINIPKQAKAEKRMKGAFWRYINKRMLGKVQQSLFRGFQREFVRVNRRNGEALVKLKLLKATHPFLSQLDGQLEAIQVHSVAMLERWARRIVIQQHFQLVRRSRVIQQGRRKVHALFAQLQIFILREVRK